MQQYRTQVEQRRRNIRLILGAIIALTVPFYCAGFILWGTAPRRDAILPTPTRGTNTPFVPQTPGADTATPSITPLFTSQPGVTLLPPITIVIPTAFPTTVPLPTRYLSPTATFLPPPTAVPTNTPPPLPTNTPSPLPFDTPPGA